MTHTSWPSPTISPGAQAIDFTKPGIGDKTTLLWSTWKIKYFYKSTTHITPTSRGEPKSSFLCYLHIRKKQTLHDQNDLS